MEGIIAVSIPIVVSLGVFAMIVAIRRMENQERLAMIERGMEPPTKKPKSDPSSTLRSSLFFIGASLGLLLAIVTTRALPGLRGGEVTGVYFALIALGAGLGLLTAFLYDKKLEKREESDF